MRLGNFVLFEKKSLANPTPEELLILGGSALGLISKQDALAIPSVNAAIRAISEAAATLDIKVVHTEEGVEAIDPDHPVSQLLHGQINDWTCSFEFIRDMVARALTCDKGAIAWINRVDGKPKEIILYSEAAGGVTYDSATGEPSYSINGCSTRPGEIVHLHGPFDKSALTMALKACTIIHHLEQHGLNLFKNAARPAVVVRFKKFMGEDALKRFKAGWTAAFGGSGNAGKTALVWDDAEVTTLTLNSTDAQFLENRRFQIEEIARAFNIPAPMIGDLSRATWSNSEQKGREFLSYCLEPWLKALEACLTRSLFNADERKNGYRIRFDRDDLTRASLTERATAINSLIASETINPNEGREWLGMEPYEGGAEFGNRNINLKPADPKAEPQKLREAA